MPASKNKTKSAPRLLKVARSGIHGRGLFAARKIRSGTRLGAYEGPRTQEDGEHVLWLDEDDGGFGIDGKNELRYVNHSTSPNAEFRGEELWAIRSIPEGAEITHHYGDDWDAE
jgi:SET domain-containing protein